LAAPKSEGLQEGGELIGNLIGGFLGDPAARELIAEKFVGSFLDPAAGLEAPVAKEIGTPEARQLSDQVQKEKSDLMKQIQKE